ncbi:hypothetical protein MBRU_09575 [Mycolicibacterium brumae DSM 44177]|nr:hypothetical protein MBRU_09575 [Mycolicibacterium brumae DSM 44177]
MTTKKNGNAKDTDETAEVTEVVDVAATDDDGDVTEVVEAATVEAKTADAGDEVVDFDDEADAPVEEADTELAWLGEQDSEAKASSSKRLIALIAAGVLFVGLLASTGFLGYQYWNNTQLKNAASAAQRAAVAYALVLTSIDSNKVDENFAQVLDGATGDFKDMYSESSGKLRQLLIDNKATAHGQVVESAVQSNTKDEAVVLLFIDQAVSNTNVPDPRLDRSRMKMTMKYVDGRWRASNVELP